jgi:hypothetical protein
MVEEFKILMKQQFEWIKILMHSLNLLNYNEYNLKLIWMFLMQMNPTNVSQLFILKDFL